EAPILECKDIVVSLDENGIVEIDPYDVVESVSDNCGNVTIDVSQILFDGSDIGNNIVIVTDTDECGNETTCEAIVTVNDENNPEFINCPEDIVVELEHGECFFLFDIPALIVLKNGEYISMDDSSSEVEFISCGDVEIGDELEPGDYVFCYEAIDLSGNSSTCSINITVISGGDPY